MAAAQLQLLLCAALQVRSVRLRLLQLDHRRFRTLSSSQAVLQLFALQVYKQLLRPTPVIMLWMVTRSCIEDYSKVCGAGQAALWQSCRAVLKASLLL